MMVAALERTIMREQCVYKGFHGVPLPYLRTLLADGELKPWPNSTKSSENLGLLWWGRELDFAASYGGPVEIGDGWMVTCAVATSASAFRGPNHAGGRVKSYAPNEAVLSGDVFVEVLHITSLGRGDGRYLPEWTAFPWEEFNQWRHPQQHDGAPKKVAKVQESCPPVVPSWLHVGVDLKGGTRQGYNVNVADITLMARLQAAEFRNEVEVLAAPPHFSQVSHECIYFAS